jgi:hypothetical protein
MWKKAWPHFGSLMLSSQSTSSTGVYFCPRHRRILSRNVVSSMALQLSSILLSSFRDVRKFDWKRQGVFPSASTVLNPKKKFLFFSFPLFPLRPSNTILLKARFGSSAKLDTS